MDFGKVPPEEINNIDFTLPAEPGRNKHILPGKPYKKVNVHVGCAKWGRKDWVGKIYPPKTKEADYLEHYSKYFDCIELNAMFYQIYGKSTIEKWKSKVGKTFKFCPKFYQGITHIRRLKNAEALTDAFMEAIYSFGENLGPCFLQLSDNFGPKKMEVLEEYIASLPKDLEVYIEVRHKDWYLPEFSKPYFDLLEKYKKGSVITDASGRRDCAHMNLTIPKTFIRFVGNGLHPTDYSRIDDWVKRIEYWMKKGIKEIYFFMHQHEELHSPELSAYTIQKLNEKCGLNIKEPVFLSNKTLFE